MLANKTIRSYTLMLTVKYHLFTKPVMLTQQFLLSGVTIAELITAGLIFLATQFGLDIGTENAIAVTASVAAVINFIQRTFFESTLPVLKE